MRFLVTGWSAAYFSFAPLLSAASAQPGEWDYGPWGMHYMWGSFGIGMMFFMLVFWILIIAGIVALVRWLWTAPSGTHRAIRGAESAEEILRKRYAKGEIDKEEFDSKLRDLRAT